LRYQRNIRAQVES